MQTSGIFTTHRVEIACEAGESIKIIPFGDVHRDSDMHAHDHWQEFLKYAKRQKNAVFIGMGDYTDGVSTSERIVLNDNNLHDTTKRTMEHVYKGVVKTLTNELSFMRGKCLGLLGGNHYFDFGAGNTTDHLLAASLGARFLGVCTLLRVVFKQEGRPGFGPAIDIFAHHGKGGGGTPGASFNTIEKMMQTADAELYLMGHTHAKGCIPSSPRIRLSHGKNMSIQERTPWLGRTGSFLKVYENDRPSYNVDAARSPNALGWIEFEITPVRQKQDGKDSITLKIRGTA